MQKSLMKNSIFNIIYTIANIMFPFLTSIYVSRILLPVGVGKVASAQNIISYFVVLGALGLPTYGVREFARIREDKKKRNKLFTELILINFLSTTCSAVGFIIILFINEGFKGEWGLYIVCGIAIFLNYINIDWMYQGLEEYGYITGRSLLIKIISFVIMLLSVKTKKDYILYALISILATGGNYFFNIIHARTYVKLDFSDIDIKKHLKPILIIACIIFLSTIYDKIDITMLGTMTTNKAVGLYTYAQKTGNIVATMSAAVTTAFLPRLSFYYENDRAAFYKLLNKGFQIICFMSVPLCAGLALVATQAVKLLYGIEFVPAALTIRLMCPLILIKAFGNLYCYQLVYSTKSEKIIAISSGCASILNIICNAVLIPRYFQNGAMIASVIGEFTTNVIQFFYMKKKVSFQVNFKILLQSLLATLIMFICVFFLMKINLPIIILLPLEVLGGGFVYLVVNLLLKNDLILEIMKMIKEKVKIVSFENDT